MVEDVAVIEEEAVTQEWLMVAATALRQMEEADMAVRQAEEVDMVLQAEAGMAHVDLMEMVCEAEEHRHLATLVERPTTAELLLHPPEFMGLMGLRGKPLQGLLAHRMKVIPRCPA